MLSKYIAMRMAQAKYKILDDRTYFGEIPELLGVWSNADNLEDCRKELQEVLEEWIFVDASGGTTFP